uniref:Uncharacterized protein n=1 Tax=Arundo donax TaxID=35708 RepID=A0A0A9HKJ8_ARUDO
MEHKMGKFAILSPILNKTIFIFQFSTFTCFKVHEKSGPRNVEKQNKNVIIENLKKGLSLCPNLPAYS